MNKYFFIVFLMTIFKIKSVEAPWYINSWVVWNIGQGQWVTHILSDECLHYDVGGEFGSFKNIKKSLLSSCGRKLNRLNLSHWDYDHMLNIPFLVKAVPNVCWQNLPEFGHTKKAAQKILQLNIPYCRKQNTKLTTQLAIWTPFIARNTNESSTIFLDEKVLLPGDSPIQLEKIWATEIENIKLTQVLILGHHGSRTSTGKNLLEQLPNIRFSIASARYKKYKHPHQDVLARLSAFNIPVLKTEDWGNIWFKTNANALH